MKGVIRKFARGSGRVGAARFRDGHLLLDGARDTLRTTLGSIRLELREVNLC
jgi:hypothetical protein